MTSKLKLGDTVRLKPGDFQINSGMRVSLPDGYVVEEAP